MDSQASKQGIKKMTVTADIKKELLSFGIKATCKKLKNGGLAKVIATVKEDSLKLLADKEQDLLDKGYAFKVYGKVKDEFGDEIRERSAILHLPSEASEIYSAELTVYASY